MTKINCKLSTLLKARSSVAESLENRISDCRERIVYLRDRSSERVNEIKAENPDASTDEIDALIKDDWRIENNASEIDLENAEIGVLEDLLASI